MNSTNISSVITNYNSIGVIIGRFQVHKLHQGHLDLISHVASKHSRVIIYLGVSSVLNSKNNPLDYISRQQMLQKQFPEIIIFPINDEKYDDVWSNKLDSELSSIFPTKEITLYGSRDSFKQFYKGKFKTEDFVSKNNFSGTEIRKQISSDIKNDENFRAGIIYSCYNKYDTVYQAIDCLVYNEDKTQILLCKKPHEYNFRLIGGFVSTKDETLMDAVKREVHEEAQIEIGDIQYIASIMVNDWRYKNECDKIMTHIHVAKYVYGNITASDDISELHWTNIKDFLDNKIPLEEEHKQFPSYIRKVF